jgi:hypothetical protein
MPILLHQRCLNHRTREAAARCPECERFFCRECITEHEGKVLCAECLRADGESDSSGTSRTGETVRIFTMAVGVTLVWLFFYYFGRILLLIPSSFHEGTIWMKN